MFKLIIFLLLVISSQITFPEECDSNQQTAILLNSTYNEPTDCTIDYFTLRSIEYHHALGYGNTLKAEKILDHWLFLNKETTFMKIHILNLHGKYNEANSRLESLSPELKKTNQTAHLIALAQTHLKLGNIISAEKYFNSIHKIDFTKQPELEFEYELVKYELLTYRNEYSKLLEQVDTYLARLMKKEGTGNAGYDLLVVAYALLAICKIDDTMNESEQRKYLRDAINSDYSELSIFHKELDRIIDRCE